MQSEDNTQKVNAIVHPAVGLDFVLSGLSWMECAILFESGFDRYVDRVVCVTAPEEVRLARVMRRDGITREAASAWMKKQMPQHEVLARSDYEIVNDGVRDVAAQVDRILGRLQIKS
jgi:dephospho-CoA kinase